MSDIGDQIEAGSDGPNFEKSSIEEKRIRLRMLYYDLQGVVLDVEREGFDNVCLNTIKRVRDALARMSQQE